MKKNSHRVRSASRNPRSRRSGLEGGLKAYSLAGKAVVAMGTMWGGAAVAQGQITNIPVGAFSGTPSVTSSFPEFASSNRASQSVWMGGAVWKIGVGQSLWAGTLGGGDIPRNWIARGYATIRGQVGLHLAGGSHTARYNGYQVNNVALGQQVKGMTIEPSNIGNVLLRTHGSAFGYGSAIHNAFGHKTTGQFNVNAVGYVGFEIKNGTNNNAYYGWLRVKVDGDSNGRPSGIEFLAVNGVYGAINNTPGGEIEVGEVSAVPEPITYTSCLGLLALGAVGVREYKRLRQRAKA